MLCIFLLLLALLFIWQSNDTPTNETVEPWRGKEDIAVSHEAVTTSLDGEPLPLHEARMTQGHGDIENLDASEQWICPFSAEDTPEEMEGKFRQMDRMLQADFELRVLAKYAAWTDEEARTRFWEIRGTGIHSEALRLEESELRLLPGARGRERSRTNPPSDWGAADGLFTHGASFYTREVEMFTYLRDRRCSKDGDMEAINRIVTRLNQAISLNKTILTYWDDLKDSWWLPPYLEEGHRE